MYARKSLIPVCVGHSSVFVCVQTPTCTQRHNYASYFTPYIRCTSVWVVLYVIVSLCLGVSVGVYIASIRPCVHGRRRFVSLCLCSFQNDLMLVIDNVVTTRCRQSCNFVIEYRKIWMLCSETIGHICKAVALYPYI